MFFLFSNRLGCLGSLIVSILLSVLLLFAMRACSTGPAWSNASRVIVRGGLVIPTSGSRLAYQLELSQ
jgi:hypothetical protein